MQPVHTACRKYGGVPGQGDRQIAESAVARYPELYMHAQFHISEDVDIASRSPAASRSDAGLITFLLSRCIPV